MPDFWPYLAKLFVVVIGFKQPLGERKIGFFNESLSAEDLSQQRAGICIEWKRMLQCDYSLKFLQCKQTV